VTYHAINPDTMEPEKVVPLLQYESECADLEDRLVSTTSAYRHLRTFTLVLMVIAALMGFALLEKAARAEGNGQRIAVLEGRG
jgi:hypothetical protein